MTPPSPPCGCAGVVGVLCFVGLLVVFGGLPLSGGGLLFLLGWGLGEVGEEGGLGSWGVPCAVGDYLEGGAGVVPDGGLGEVGVHPVGADDEGVHGPDLFSFTGCCLGGHPYQGLDVRSSSVYPQHLESVY